MNFSQLLALNAQNDFLTSIISSEHQASSNLTAITFESKDKSVFKEQYKFTEVKVQYMRERLSIPALIKLNNGTRVNSNLGFCVLLDKLSYKIKNKRLQSMYGIHCSVVIRLINYLLELIDNQWTHTVTL